MKGMTSYEFYDARYPPKILYFLNISEDVDQAGHDSRILLRREKISLKNFVPISRIICKEVNKN